jgi:hypothetical protein
VPRGSGRDHDGQHRSPEQINAILRSDHEKQRAAILAGNISTD